MEGVRGLAWAVSRARADSTLMSLLPGGAHRDGFAPQGAALPILLLSISSDTDKEVINDEIIGSDVLILFRAQTPPGGWLDVLEQILDRVHTLFHKASGSVDGAEIWYSTRERKLYLPASRVGGEVYESLGAEYRLQLAQES